MLLEKARKAARTTTRTGQNAAGRPRAASLKAVLDEVAPWEETLTDKAYAHLEEMIVTLKLPPGSAVSEAGLSKHLGIGRTPIREALQRLARERLVLILPRRGIIVSEVDIKQQLRLLETRRELERLICRSAARRATEEERQRFAEIARIFEKAAKAGDDTTFMRVDREFHLLCSAAARNEFAANAMSVMHALSRRFWFIHYKQAGDMPLTAKLHADIARAIAAQDEAGAARGCDRLLDAIETFTRATVSPDA